MLSNLLFVLTYLFALAVGGAMLVAPYILAVSLGQ